MVDLISLSLRIPKALAASIEATAKRLGVSKSEYARRAMEAFEERLMQERIAELSLRVRIQKTADLKRDTDLLIDQGRAISNARFMFRYCTVTSNLLRRVEEALRILTGR